MTTLATPESSAAAAPPKAWKIWTGRVLSAVPILMMLFSASMKLSHAAQFEQMWTQHFGFAESALTPVGLLELVCVAVYAVPKTSVLGAGLLSAYLGGAVVTHLRIGEPFVAPIVLGLLVWAGLYLREPRLSALLPVRK